MDYKSKTHAYMHVYNIAYSWNGYIETILNQLLTALCTFQLFIHATKTFSHNNLPHKVLHEPTYEAINALNLGVRLQPTLHQHRSVKAICCSRGFAPTLVIDHR